MLVAETEQRTGNRWRDLSAALSDSLQQIKTIILTGSPRRLTAATKHLIACSKAAAGRGR